MTQGVARKDVTVDEANEFGGEQILLVDDNPTNLQILYKTLQGSGYRLLVAKSGEAALEIAARVQLSLVLLDIMMPGIDGFEVCRMLKQDKRTRDVAVIFLSALDDSVAKVRGFAVGGVDYIAKPFQADEVVARVRTHVKIHRLETQLARRNNELEEENQQILNAVDEGIVGLDRDGRITLINPAASTIAGWSAGDVIGERVHSLGLFEADRSRPPHEQQTPAYQAYRLGQTVRRDQDWVYRQDGRAVPVSLTCSPRKEGGAVLVFRDISEWIDSEEALRHTREELESQRQHLAHMERLSTSVEMAAGIAHEVNQPLTAVVNYSRVGKRMVERETIDGAALADVLEKIDRQAVRAADVIQRLRSYVKKPDAGRERVDMEQLMHDVIALAEVDSRMADVAIHFECAHKLPPVQVDVVQIQQVALNLIRNAIEAVAKTESRAFGVVVHTDMDEGWVCFRVSHRGPGLSPEVEKNLFHPFFSTKEGGMGVGLSICQNIVQAHGGEIGYYRNETGGATFYCRLPPAD